MGELARQPGAPELPRTPLEVLTPRPGEGFTTAQKYSWPVVGGAVGLFSGVALNRLQLRPYWSGIHRLILFSGASAYLSILIRDLKFASKAEDDAVMKHYISLHPEDFPPYERKRYAEVYVPFDPVR